MPQASYERVTPGSFDSERHFYPRVLNAQMHALVRFFLQLSNERIIHRYCYLNPGVDDSALQAVLDYKPRYFRWAGCDLFHVTTMAGRRRMVVVETNSCPSGQKSMPLYEEHDEQGGYSQLLRRSFVPRLKSKRLPMGELAVIYDKNPMEASGYAAALADLTGEAVHLVTMYDGEADPLAWFEEGVLQVRTPDGPVIPIRAAFRYVTQRPWARIPVITKTLILNPILSCLAGGRNKLLGAKAYDLYNAELDGTGLQLNTPDTVWDVSHQEVPIWVRKMGGIAVVKNPYSNAGQGVWTITSEEELDAFMEIPQGYDRFIVQSLIGHRDWSSTTTQGRLYHIGTVPTRKLAAYVADLRFMVSGDENGFRPLAIYARRARLPLDSTLSEHPSWDILGTNLSVKQPDGSWGSETKRLLLMDRKDFNNLGIGIDDLIIGFIQTVLAAIAVDKMAVGLVNKKGAFRARLFRSLNDDPRLVDEVLL